MLTESCGLCSLTVNGNKTKTMLFQHPDCESSTCCFLYAREAVEQVNEFKYLKVLMHGTVALKVLRPRFTRTDDGTKLS